MTERTDVELDSPHHPQEPSPGSGAGATSSLAGRFMEVRAHTERLVAPLSAEDQTVQSMPDSSPTKWHRAHTTWFFETFVLGVHVEAYEAYDPAFDYLFNSYYESVGERHPRPSRGMVTRPGAATVGEYRAAVDRAMFEFLEGPVPAEARTVVELGLHHEQQHQELILMDALHLLSSGGVRSAYDIDGSRHGSTSGGGSREWVPREGGLIQIGHAGSGFAFDNEGPRHSVWVDPFLIASGLVTNGDWLEFIDDGGYERADLWLSDGLATVRSNDWRAPMYWHRDADSWTEFTLAGDAPLDVAAPVTHVSYYEADVFARWAGARLPTEAEWEHAVAHSTPGGDELSDVFGAVWQWTSSPYVAYPGFVPPDGAISEYNAKFMSNQMVLRGSCLATPVGHERLTYRNFFPPGARWAFSGVRLARNP